MAANVTAANPRYADRHDALATLAASCDAQRTTLLALIDADAAGFLPLQRAYAIPKDDPTRAARLADAAHTACLAPLAGPNLGALLAPVRIPGAAPARITRTPRASLKSRLEPPDFRVVSARLTGR